MLNGMFGKMAEESIYQRKMIKKSETLKRSIDGKPLIYTVDVPSIDQSGDMAVGRWFCSFSYGLVFG